MLADYPNPDVDYGLNGCLVALDDKNLFLAGGLLLLGALGDEGSAEAYIYNRDVRIKYNAF